MNLGDWDRRTNIAPPNKKAYKKVQEKDLKLTITKKPVS